MTIEETDTDCPDCGANLHVIYVTELKQAVSGWACPNCGYLASKREGYEDSVELTNEKEYLLRVEKPLSSGDIRQSASSVEEEFRERARHMEEDELWLLIDPADGEVVDAVVGDNVEDRDE